MFENCDSPHLPRPLFLLGKVLMEQELRPRLGKDFLR